MSDTSWRSGLVRHGVSQPAFIEESEGKNPSMYFKFRVISAPEAEKRLSVFRKKIAESPELGMKEMQSVLTDYLTEWSLDDPLAKETIELLRHPLLIRAFYIILQIEASDKIPDEYNQTTVDETIKK